MTDKEKESILMKVIAIIKEDGLKVYVPEKEDFHTYALITDGKSIGYVQYNLYDGISFSSVHIPSKDNGSSFRVGEIPYGIDEREIVRLARRSLDNNPEIKQWFSRYKVKKYKDWEDFESRHWRKLQQI